MLKRHGDYLIPLQIIIDCLLSKFGNNLVNNSLGKLIHPDKCRSEHACNFYESTALNKSDLNLHSGFEHCAPGISSGQTDRGYKKLVTNTDNKIAMSLGIKRLPDN